MHWGPFFAGLLTSIDFQLVFLVDAFLYTALFALVHHTIKKNHMRYETKLNLSNFQFPF